MRISHAIWALLGTMLSINVQAGSISLGQASKYNLFVKENFQGTYSDTEGAAAIGGNLIVNGGYDFGYVNSSADATLLVGGNIEKSGSGYLNIYDGAGNTRKGDLVYGGNYNVTGGGVGASQKTKGSSDVNFNTAFKYLNQLSDELAAKTTPDLTTNRNHRDGILVFTPAKVVADNVYVFNVSQTDLNHFHTIRVDSKNIAKDALIVFNMSNKEGVQAKNWTPQSKCAVGQKDCMSMTQVRYEVGQLNSNNPAISNNVLFNFIGVNDLRIASSVYGSILAPKAAISTDWGVIWGQVMAKSWSGNQQINWAPLNLPAAKQQASVSAPSTLILMLIIGIFWLFVRGWMASRSGHSYKAFIQTSTLGAIA
jgi:choice-of-anchor A domain-containing protein